MENGIIKAFIEGGIGIGLAIALVALFYLVVKHVLKSQDKILDMATVQNEGWQKVINEHTSQAKVFHDSVTEAHKYQRDEHKECSNGIVSVCNNLTLMNEASKSFRTFVESQLETRKKEQEKILEALQKVVVNLDEVSVTLGRINGYKHD